MRIDDLADEHERFLDRARGVLGWEIEKAKKTAVALNAEKATAQAALTELQNQQKVAEGQLKEVLSNLDRASTLAKLDHDITEAKKQLEKLNADTAKATTALEAVLKQHKDAERSLNEANDGMQRLRQERADATTEIGNIRKLLHSVSI
jgi:chromosome segregation ATPase